jgi:predicted O-linked N-acetylglucosamine transferase (SPINDLY family)
MSADFNRSPMALLITELFELHDRSRFEVIGISLGRDDKSDMRSRLIKSFDRFCDVEGKADTDKDHGISGAKGREKRPAFDARCRDATKR